MIRKISCAAVILACFGSVVLAGDPFAENVRPTDALTPEQELKSFHLPPGFEIQLVTAEPDILKPLNMQFDARGRLWVSMTKEYPFPAAEGQGRDCIKVIEIGRDGHASKITTFAEHLNIPIGLYPYKNGVIAHSIPKISMYSDNDGDGHADKAEILYGDIGYKDDTHGMTNGFRRGFDGWLYAVHGFRNTSVITAKDGSSINLFSGNSYRMRLDGSHIEQFTWGQTNPHGTCFDPLGNFYSSDSHSMPIMQLLRGGWYIGIFKTDDGLGFAPHMMDHSHGSTAIAGVSYYGADQWPAEYRGNMFVGNVVTSRINRDSIEHHGSSPWAIEQPDFLTTDDPWFRPVDTQIGPDGSMYVSDFYNKIIGHYEVPLTHPGRDHEHGRIWRISYKGAPADMGPDWTKVPVGELVAGLKSANLQVRLTVTNELCDRGGAEIVDAVKHRLDDPAVGAFEKMHGIWVLQRLGALELPQLQQAARDLGAGVRVHAMRILAEIPKWSAAHHELAIAGLCDSDALVQRCAADALGLHPSPANVRPLLELRKVVPSTDTHLMHVVRMSLRDQVREPGTLTKLTDLSDQDVQLIADVLLSIPTVDAAQFIMVHADALAADKQKITHTKVTVSKGRGKVVAQATDQEKFRRYLEHAIRYIDPAGADAAVAVARKQFANDVDMQLDLLKSLVENSSKHANDFGPKVREWAADLASEGLGAQTAHAGDWMIVPDENSPETPWGVQPRHSADGDTKGTFLCSIPFGETLTGKLRSKEFVIPSQLSFFMAGHDGHPNNAPSMKNFVRLVTVDDGKVIEQSPPPRNDLAQAVKWNLENFAGRKGYLELVDGDDGTAYAWLAIGRFSPTVVTVPAMGPHAVQRRPRIAAELAGELKLQPALPALQRIFADPGTITDVRVAAGQALVRLNCPDVAELFAPVLKDPAAGVDLREKFAAALGDIHSPAVQKVLLDTFASAPPARVQTALAMSLANNREGGSALLDAVEQGKAPARLLVDINIKQALTAANVPDLVARIKTLTHGLPSAQESIDQLIATRRLAYLQAKPVPERGQKIFTTYCAVCHQIASVGKLVGPQLDGIGNRGVDRVMEDVLDPNRNVDPAFRYFTFNMKDGRTITALQKREEAQTLVVVQANAKQLLLRKDEVAGKVESKMSLMPSNFSEIIKPDDFYDLISYLLTQRGQAKK